MHNQANAQLTCSPSALVSIPQLQTSGNIWVGGVLGGVMAEVLDHFMSILAVLEQRAAYAYVTLSGPQNKIVKLAVSMFVVKHPSTCNTSG
jgi:hypothetical protein